MGKNLLVLALGLETFDFAAGDSSKLRFTFKLIVPCPEMAAKCWFLSAGPSISIEGVGNN